jgi:hypothetical protein
MVPGHFGRSPASVTAASVSSSQTRNQTCKTRRHKNLSDSRNCRTPPGRRSRHHQGRAGAGAACRQQAGLMVGLKGTKRQRAIDRRSPLDLRTVIAIPMPRKQGGQVRTQIETASRLTSSAPQQLVGPFLPVLPRHLQLRVARTAQNAKYESVFVFQNILFHCSSQQSRP